MISLRIKVPGSYSKINEIELVHLLQFIFEVTNHDVVWFDITMYVPFVMHPLNEIQESNTDADYCLCPEMLLIPSDQIIDGET